MAEASPVEDRRPRSRIADVAAVAVLFGLITVVFSDVWFGGNGFFIRDLARYYFPVKRILHDLVRAGEFPLWNRFFSAGQPLAANPEYELFYPGQWPIFLRDFYFGFRLHILLHFYIGALAMYSLMRSLRTSVGAALITATAFVFGGPLLSLANLLPTFFGTVWLPFTILFGRRFLLYRRRRDFVLTAVFVALQALTFDPAVPLETLAALVVCGVWIGESGRAKAALAAMACAMFAGGLLIAAVQVIPLLGHIRDTPRATRLSFDTISYWSMPPVRLMELLQPRFAGRNPFLSDDYWGGAAYRQATTPYLHSLYLGCAALVALIAGFLRKERGILALTGCSIVAWIAAFGEHTPLLRIAYAAHLPTVLRFPERFAVIAAFALTIAAGLAIDRIINEASWRKTAVGVSAVLAVICILISFFTFTSSYADWFAAMWQATGLPIVRHWIAESRIDWLLTTARVVALAALLLITRRMPARVVALALAAFVAADLLPLTREIVPRQPREFFEAPPVVRELRQPSSGYRIFFEPEWSSGSISRRYFANAPTRPWTLRNELFPRLPAAYGFSTVFERDIDLTNVAGSDELTEAMWKVRRSGRPDWAEAFAAMSNVGYRAAYRPFDQEIARHPDPKDVEPITFVPVGPNPRYYFADEIVPVSNTDDFVRRMIVERHSARAAYLAIAPFVPAPGFIGRASESSNGAVLDVSAAGRALLVCSVTWHRDWQATVDGVPATIRRTNVAYQSVEIPPGRHRVVLRYRDPLVVVGAVVSALALMACALVAVPRSRRVTAASTL